MRAEISAAGRWIDAAEEILQPVFAELLLGGIERFGDAVGERDEHIAGLQVDGRLLVCSSAGTVPSTVPPIESSWISGSSTPARRPSRARSRYGGLWPALTYRSWRAALVELRVEERRVAVRAGRAMQEVIHLRRELRQRRPFLGGDDPERRLHDGHDERRGDAFAGDVGQRDADPRSPRSRKS